MLTAHALSPENTIKSYREGAAYYIPKEKIINIQIYLKDVLMHAKRGIILGCSGLRDSDRIMPKSLEVNGKRLKNYSDVI